MPQDNPYEAFDEPNPYEEIEKGEGTLKSAETWADISNRWSQGMAHKMLRGMTLGASEHLPLPEETQQNIAQFEQEHPIVSTVSEVAGAIPSALGATKLAVSKAPAVSNWITAKVPTWAQYATGGGVTAGIYGANVAEPGERVSEGLTGGVFGAIAGPVLATAMKMASKLGKGTWDTVTRMLQNTSEKQAERILRSAVDAEDLSPEFIQQRLDELGPEASLADVSEGMARTLRGAAAIDSGAHGIATTFLNTRQTGQVGRLARAAGGEGFDSEQYARNFSRWMRNRETEARQLYDTAYQASLEATEGLVELMNRPSVKKAMEAATRNISEEGGGVNDVRFFQYVKEELDDRIGEAIRAGRRNEARRLTQTKRALVEEIDAQVPEYAQARSLFAGERQLRDSAEMGYEVVSRKTDLWVIEDALEAMSKSEQDAFRMGALRGIVDRLDTTREGRNVAATMIDSNRARQLLRVVFPDEDSFQRFMRTAEAESQFSRTRNTVVGGSPTSRIDADKQAVTTAAGVAAAARQGSDVVAMALSLFRQLGVNDPSPEALKLVATTLVSRYGRIASRSATRPNRQSQLVGTAPYAVAGGIASGQVREEVQK